MSSAANTKRSYYKNKLSKAWQRGHIAVLCTAYKKRGDNINFCDLHVFVQSEASPLTLLWLQWAGRVNRGRVKVLENDGLCWTVNGANNLWKEFKMDPILLSALISNTKKWLELP